jgi:hypothetical protein
MWNFNKRFFGDLGHEAWNKFWAIFIIFQGLLVGNYKWCFFQIRKHSNPHQLCIHTPTCGSTTPPRNRSLDKDGTMKEVQNMLDTFNTILIRVNKIHLFSSQLGEILLKGFYDNHNMLIFKDHISTINLNMIVVKNEIVYHIKHTIITKFLNNKL